MIDNQIMVERMGDFFFLKRSWLLLLLSLILFSSLVIQAGSTVKDVNREDGAETLNISQDGSLQNPTWSPDGNSILFTRFRNGYNEEPADLFVFELESNSIKTLVSDGSGNINLPGSSWNSVTHKIVFSSSREPHDEIYIIDEKGNPGDEVQITDREEEVTYEPSLSPDGQWVVFESHHLDVEGNGIITKCKENGIEYQMLTGVDDDCRQPNWAPSGDLILYQKQTAGQWDIWVMNTNGTNHRKVTDGVGDKTDASFSPDGKWIVYSSNEEGLEFANIFLKPVSDGPPIRLTYNGDGYDGAPSWSPDGKIIVFEFCTGEPDDSEGTTLGIIDVPAGLLSPAESLMGIKSWAYQLQNIDVSQIADNETFDLIVMDYSNDGSDDGKFTSEDLSQIKNSGKKAISYISIGEAESYRFYWKQNWDADHDGSPDPGAPAWLGEENPEWEGNYKVRFWHTEWQNIIFSYIDAIYAQGFDGIYMDIIDAYYYWMEESPEESHADSLMIQFLLNIRTHADGLSSNDFYLIPQNGEYIIEEMNVSESLKTAYFESIDGIGIEDLFFIGEEDENNYFNPDVDRIKLLEKFLENGKQIFSVEYLTDTDLIQQYVTSAEQNNFVPYATTRALDTLHDGILLSVESNELNVPQSFVMFQNYPNPFNPVTTIKYSIYKPTQVELKIYNLSGQEIETLVNCSKSSGEHEATWRPNGFASGNYFYRLQAGDFSETKKLILQK